MPTAFTATAGSGSPVIGLMADYDGVPGANQRPGIMARDELIEGALMAKYRQLLEKYYYNPDSPKTYLEELGVQYPPKASAAR